MDGLARKVEYYIVGEVCSKYSQAHERCCACSGPDIAGPVLKGLLEFGHEFAVAVDAAMATFSLPLK
jgi:hypothetical protein